MVIMIIKNLKEALLNYNVILQSMVKLLYVV